MLGEAAAALIVANIVSYDSEFGGGVGENRRCFVITTTNIMKEASFELLLIHGLPAAISFLLHVLLIQNVPL